MAAILTKFTSQILLSHSMIGKSSHNGYKPNSEGLEVLGSFSLFHTEDVDKLYSYFKNNKTTPNLISFKNEPTNAIWVKGTST